MTVLSVAAGGLFEPSSDGRVHNTVLVTGPGVEASYRKIHLYDAFGSRESDTVAPGKELVTFRWRDVTIGVATTCGSPSDQAYVPPIGTDPLGIGRSSLTTPWARPTRG